jgi:hypothetical protein
VGIGDATMQSILWRPFFKSRESCKAIGAVDDRRGNLKIKKIIGSHVGCIAVIGSKPPNPFQRSKPSEFRTTASQTSVSSNPIAGPDPKIGIL